VDTLCQNLIYFGFHKYRFDSVLAGVGMEEFVKEVKEENDARYRRIEAGKNVTIEQQQAISELPFRVERVDETDYMFFCTKSHFEVYVGKL